MRIGFDLDKIFIDYPPFVPDTLIEKLYRKKANGVLLYRIPTRPEQYVRKFSHVPFFRPLIKENVTFLKRIPRKHHKLYLISSRFGFLEQQTKSLLQKHGLDKLFDGMFFNFENKQPHIFKHEILQKLNLDVYVDDDLHLLNYVADRNKKTAFFWLTTVNKKHLYTTGKNIIPITKLSEILS